MDEELSLLTELIKLSRCDNEVREKEYDFLLSIAQSLHVGKEDFDGLFDKYIHFTPPESEFDRILQFHRLVLLMNIDEKNSEKELHFIKDISTHGTSSRCHEQGTFHHGQLPQQSRSGRKADRDI